MQLREQLNRWYKTIEQDPVMMGSSTISLADVPTMVAVRDPSLQSLYDCEWFRCAVLSQPVANKLVRTIYLSIYTCVYY